MEKLKILIVDDEVDMCRVVKRILQKFKIDIKDLDLQVAFEPDYVYNGNDALKQLDEKSYDLVLLDYKLPDLNGLEVLGKINTLENDLLVVMVTAYASIEVAISATKIGAFDFLAKPFSPEELYAVIRKAATRLVLQRHAKKLEKEKKQVRFKFLSVLSHELKAPINAVDGYLKLMRDRIAGDQVQNYDDMIKRSLNRIDAMRRLIFDLLDLTRIESGQKTRKLGTKNIVEIAKFSFDNFKNMATQKNIKFEIQSEKEILFECDDNEIEIIFNNLISNAIKYNRENGSVFVKLSKENSILTIKVEDTGIGISKKDQENLFNEFSRIKNSKTRQIEGSGLGLSILKSLTNLYNGSIEVTSEEDKGTSFKIILKN